MSIAFTDQHQRLRRIVENALDGATYRASHEEEPRLLVVEAARPDGRHVTLRFRGVKDSEASATPEAGATMRLLGIGSAERFSILRFLIPFPIPRTRYPGGEYARVRIEAGSARLDIVCQDAEWWEDEAGPGASGETTP
jgi:hypothetical protein